MNKIEKFSQAQFEPIKSFKLKDDLNRTIWNDDNTLKQEILEQLEKIATDFWGGLEFDAGIKDIVFCGSLCGYNWSKYSDIDLHILVDYGDLGEDHDLIETLFDSVKKLWNEQHNIVISNYDIEIAVQDKSDFDAEVETPRMGGAFSILNNEWIKEPNKDNFKPDEELIRTKSKALMQGIKEVEEDFKEGCSWEDLDPRISKIWKKIKDGRKAGLEREGEFSIENLVFKLLRRNGYIERIMNLKRKSYDKQFK